MATKAVVLLDGTVAGCAVERTGAEPQAAAERALAAAVEQAGLARSTLDRVVATGYGRRSIDFADAVVTEITAAARGVRNAAAAPPCLLIDLGGQDTKVILLDPAGAVADFVMNDKCAAGTGRFLEVMAGVLGVPLEELGRIDARAEAPAPIHATCTVFAESEVVSLISRGVAREAIAAGLHAAVADRIAQMVQRIRPPGKGDVWFIGGGARNEGVRRAIERRLGRSVHVPPRPQHIVAAGAALG